MCLNDATSRVEIELVGEGGEDCRPKVCSAFCEMQCSVANFFASDGTGLVIGDDNGGEYFVNLRRQRIK